MKTAAIIGCGKRSGAKEGHAIAHHHATACRNVFPDVQLFGVDPNADNLQAFGEKFGLPVSQLFASTEALYKAVVPDVVSICTWPRLHHPQVIEAAKAGVKGICCEKPMALDGSEMDEMLQACAKHKVQLAIAHQRRHELPFEKARDVIAAGTLGQDLVLEARVDDGWDILSWTVHWFDMANFLFNAEPEWVMAGMDHNGQRRYQHAVEDASVIFAQYPGKRQAIFVTGPVAPLGATITVRGRAGLLHITGKTVDVWTETGKVSHPTKVEQSGFHGLFRELDAAIRTGSPMRCGADRCAVATRMAYAAHEAARTGQRATFPSVVGYAPLEVMQHPPRKATIAGNVVLFADAHHADPVTGEGGREGLAGALLSLGFEVSVVKAEQRELTEHDLTGADALVIYHTRRKSSPELRDLLSKWVNEGRPLVVSHCGIGAYSDWPQYRQWLGYYWVWHDEDLARASGHPHVPCDIEVLDPDTFSPGWQQAWLPRDEVYVKLGTAAPVRELACAKFGNETAPVAWQTEKHPNVVVWAPGHRRDIWTLPVIRDGLRAALDLASKR